MLKEQIIEIEIFADYFQFYLQDDSSDKGNLEDSWSDLANNQLLATAPFVVGIGTARNMDVPVKIHLLAQSPKVDFEIYDLVNQCGLEIETGKIVVAGCTDYFPEALRIDVPNGLFEVLIGYGNLDKLSENGLDGDDFYDIFISPTNDFIEVKTLTDRKSKQ